MERADLGSDLGDLGRRLAERWGCDPLVVDAAWLHADPHGLLNRAASSPDRLATIQEAYRWAEQTPWALRRPVREPVSHEPRLRILMAEVQARCGVPFVDPSATPHEERATRQNARLAAPGRPAAGRAGSRRAFPRAAGGVEPGRDARGMGRPCGHDLVRGARRRGRADHLAWARRAGLCPPGRRASAERRGPAQFRRRRTRVGRTLVRGRGAGRGPGREFPDDPPRLGCLGRPARRPFAAGAAASGGRHFVPEPSRRPRTSGSVATKLDALGEFAAGAGHELNNPLAVIVGRAQLLLARAEDPEVVRSLRIITGQAQRAHRILRDLMFVARPPGAASSALQAR